MTHIVRIILAFTTLAASAASQALNLDYSGSGSATPVGGTFSTTSLGALPGDQFGFASSVTTGSLTQVQLFTASGTSGLTLIYSNPTITPYADGNGSLFSAFATATGFGDYAGYTGTNIGITRNLRFSYVISIQGSASPVPEPSAFAAMGLGVLGIATRRRKA